MRVKSNRAGFANGLQSTDFSRVFADAIKAQLKLVLYTPFVAFRIFIAEAVTIGRCHNDQPPATAGGSDNATANLKSRTIGTRRIRRGARAAKANRARGFDG